MTAVIYARYSSDNQREESIEGQIRECTAYAEKNGITIVKHYIDRAISAKTDNRPEFQQMIKDSDKKLFDIVLVWKLDRFARNRYDSARYKTQLKKNGVKLMSATEIISEGPEGIILESVLEGYAEYYSADLAEKVVRGQTENILKGRCNGGRGTFGYTLDSERKFHIDPLTSPFVLESFKKYNEGSTMKEIRDWLNENGIKNPVGGAFTYNSVEHMLKNRRYIGELKFRDVVVPDAIPPIIPLELFEDVQEKIAKNKKAPARRKAEDDYLLTTKLFCGYCGALMFGESGTSRTGEVHRYYKCATAKKHKGCKKKTVRKQWLEDLVVNQTMQLVKDDAAMESIIAKVMELQNKENTNIPLYEKQLRDAESGIQNMLNAIQAGILTSSTKERLEQLEETKRELEARIAEEKLAKPKVTEEFIRFWLLRFRKLDMSLKDQRQALVDTFINAIYLYDDKVLITFNYKEGTQTVTFGEAAEAASKGNGSDLDCFTAPKNAVKSKDFMAFLFFRHGTPDRLRHAPKPHRFLKNCTTPGSISAPKRRRNAPGGCFYSALLRLHIPLLQQEVRQRKHRSQPEHTAEKEQRVLARQHVGAAVGVHAGLHQGVGPQQAEAFGGSEDAGDAAKQSQKDGHRKAADDHGQHQLRRNDRQRAQSPAQQKQRQHQGRGAGQAGEHLAAEGVQHEHEGVGQQCQLAHHHELCREQRQRVHGRGHDEVPVVAQMLQPPQVGGVGGHHGREEEHGVKQGVLGPQAVPAVR